MKVLFIFGYIFGVLFLALIIFLCVFGYANLDWHILVAMAILLILIISPILKLFDIFKLVRYAEIVTLPHQKTALTGGFIGCFSPY
jgi:hypothetical protein